jgi:hypothetical protein
MFSCVTILLLKGLYIVRITYIVHMKLIGVFCDSCCAYHRSFTFITGILDLAVDSL